MKLLHTSDWHLGQHFFGKSRAAEHRQFLSWLVDTVIAYHIDVVIVAGDIFDTGSPPSYARELYNRFVVDLRQSNAQLIVLAGNHDSVATLAESKGILACLNTQVVAQATEDLEQQVLKISDPQGQEIAVVCAVPYLRPRDVMTSQADQSGAEKQGQLVKAISDHYQRLYRHAQVLQAEVSHPVPIIATGHLTAVGARTSDSVREIYIGTLEALPASAFPEADYIALGHIHQSQRIAQTEHIRYCGSPIPLSFDEAKQQKSVLLVEFDGSNLVSVEPLIVPLFQVIVQIKSDLESLKSKLEALESPTDDAVIWLDIEIASQDYLSDLQQRVQAILSELDCPLEILALRRQRGLRRDGIERARQETLSELKPIDVFERRLEGEPELTQDHERTQRLKQLFLEIEQQWQEESQ